MTGYLVALIWPVGMVAIAGAAFLLTRGERYTPGVGVVGREAGRHHGRRARGGSGLAEVAVGSGRFAIIAAVGAVVAFGVMSLLGLLVVNHGLAVDRPVFHWLSHHQVHLDAALMNRLTKIGNTWTAWGAAVAAAVCLAVTSRDRRWLAPVALTVLIVVDHFTTLALRHEFHRLGPPTSPLGTYPSGGADRCIVFYGLIAYLLWREFSGRRATAIWAGAAVAALGFNEAYSRTYLGLHWFTDALSGLLYGGLLLAAFITATRMVAGRPVTPRSGEQAAAIPNGMSSMEHPVV